VICTFHSTRMDDAHKWWLKLPGLSSLRSIYGQFSIRYALQKSEAVTAVSKGVLESILGFDRGSGGKHSVVYLGVAVQDGPHAAERKAVRKSLGIPLTSPLILHVGRFTEEKNHRAILSVFSLVLAKCQDARLLLVGEGPLRHSTEQLVAGMKLEDRVKFCGNRDDVDALMSSCDVFLFPSLHEGLPLVVLEAGAAGVPVVGTRIPGLMEAVEEGRSALLHDVSDITGMANSVIRILKHKAFAGTIGQEAKAHVLRTFSSQAAAQRLLTLYADCLRPLSVASPSKDPSS